MSKLYLPQVEGGPTIAGQADKARTLFDLMRNHPSQGRKGMEWDELLAYVAQHKCRLQALDGWTGHTDPDGYGPNFYVRQAGYKLPDWYDQADDANNIESTGHGGQGDPESVWDGWLASARHRVHVLATDKFFAEQTHVGIGYHHDPDSEWKHYWVILSAPPEN